MGSLTEKRAFFKPFDYPWAYDAWLQSEQSHWLHTEVPMFDDQNDWKKKLTGHEKFFLTNIFRFFTQGDIDVNEGYVDNYLPFFKPPEIRMMLSSFSGRETLHIAAYSHLIETLGMPDSTYEEFLKYDAMRQKHEYLLERAADTSSKESVALNIATFSAFTEGMQLFSSFIMLLNFPRHNKMKGMGQIITWSIVDETLHTESMIRLFRTYIEENREIWTDDLKWAIYTIAERMVALEDLFIDLCFEMGPMEGLTAEDVKRYIRYICDRRLIAMGLKGINKVKRNPLPWVEAMLNAPTHTNFFEQRVTDYAKGTLSGKWEDVWG